MFELNLETHIPRYPASQKGKTEKSRHTVTVRERERKNDREIDKSDQENIVFMTLTPGTRCVRLTIKTVSACVCARVKCLYLPLRYPG